MSINYLHHELHGPAVFIELLVVVLEPLGVAGHPLEPVVEVLQPLGVRRHRLGLRIDPLSVQGHVMLEADHLGVGPLHAGPYLPEPLVHVRLGVHVEVRVVRHGRADHGGAGGAGGGTKHVTAAELGGSWGKKKRFSDGVNFRKNV